MKTGIKILKKNINLLLDYFKEVKESYVILQRRFHDLEKDNTTLRKRLLEEEKDERNVSMPSDLANRDTENSKEMKQKIDSLVKEIDFCIEKLSE